ncbi:MAG: xanthine phosphoribosyltransferase [Streptococcaceae bacterium]|nr:xanthine phosphoribosyltransferase [Streptococcaceae bacterium]
MKELMNSIVEKGTILGEGILKVDSFLNHQVDPELMYQIGESFAQKFNDRHVTKVVTIEASGIAPALTTAQALGVPMIYARKTKSITMNSELLTTEVYSFTKQVTSTISISKHFLNEEDNVLLIDDFLANGQAAKGLIELVEQAGANVVGVGILIEKSYQQGRALLNDMGVEVVSLARIASMVEGEVEFLEADL